MLIETELWPAETEKDLKRQLLSFDNVKRTIEGLRTDPQASIVLWRVWCKLRSVMPTIAGLIIMKLYVIGRTAHHWQIQRSNFYLESRSGKRAKM